MDTQDPNNSRKLKLDVQALTGSHSVKRVDLCPSLKPDGSSKGNDLIKELLDKAMCNLVGELVARNSVIDSLRINPGQGTDGGRVLELMQACKSSGLRTLDLNGIGLGPRGSPQLFENLHAGMCSNLTKLCLAANSLADSKLDHLVNALSTDSCTLSALDLSKNHVTGVLIFRALASNRSLTSLDLRDNPITDEQMLRIGTFLQKERCACKLGFISVTIPQHSAQHAAHHASRTLVLNEGVSALDLTAGHEASSSEAELEPGAFQLLAGVLKVRT